MWNLITDVTPPPGEAVLVTVAYHNGHAIDDAASGDRLVTLGIMDLDDSGNPEWHVTGWDWDQDCLCDVQAEVIAWAPRPQPATTY